MFVRVIFLLIGAQTFSPPSRCSFGRTLPAVSGAFGNVRDEYLQQLETSRSKVTAPVANTEAALSDVDAKKAALLDACEAFTSAQEAAWAAEPAEPEGKTSRRSKKRSNERVGSLLEAESFGAVESASSAALATLRDTVLACVAALAPLNPTARPLDGWRGRNGLSSSPLAGRWKLVFTNAADATFKKGKRGSASTSQLIDSVKGLFVNCVDFEPEPGAKPPKLKGFRVEVEGTALSDSEVQLAFRRIRLLRRSKVPWLLGRITIPLPPPRLLRVIGRVLSRGKADKADRGAGFTILYLDDTLRMHQTFDGLFFVQKRLPLD